MSRIAIRAEHLSKQYFIGAHQERAAGMGEKIRQLLTGPFRYLHSTLRQPSDTETLWAIRDISFEVQRGEVVGIIGHNGAGKSTLLKVLANITEPTDGRVQIYGRIGSLLEVGTGFHPELTGRENIFLNGTILGMRRTEINRKFDEIVDFAGVDRFIDMPVKRYSSGMKVRLAFAVAAHLEPEILLIDEVLAVGDAAFQQKCLGRMSSLAGEGRTVLFVSHDMQAMSTLTERCIVLSGGQETFSGPTEEAIQQYLSDIGTTDLIYTDAISETEPRVTHIALETTDPGNVQRNGAPLTIHFQIDTPRPIKEARLACQVMNSFGQPVSLLATFDTELPMCREAGSYKLTCHIPKNRLYFGKYTLRVRLAQALNMPRIQEIEHACPFEVVFYGQQRDYPRYKDACVYTEDAEWQAEKLV